MKGLLVDGNRSVLEGLAGSNKKGATENSVTP
jgi:hypothetical protein